MIDDLTPIEYRDGIFFKRDDAFSVFGVHGGKARSAYQIIKKGICDGYCEFVTAGSRMSPQCEIVSAICEGFGVKAHLFMPNGKETSVIRNIALNKSSLIHRSKVGYNSVICHDAKEYAKIANALYIPFGLECVENIITTQEQVRNIPKEAKRIVVPCGSGMSMISIIKGLEKYQMFNIRVVGVVVGKSPSKTFNRFIEGDGLFRTTVDYIFVKSKYDYYQHPKETRISGIELDHIYEAKCIPFLENGDLLWIVGHRK